MVVLYALLSAFSFGTADFLGGFSSRRNSATAAVLWSQGAGLLAVLVAAPLLGAAAVSGADLLWGIAGGLSGAVGVLLLFTGLANGLSAIVSPLAALTGAVFPVLFGLILGERPPLLTWTGVALALPAILFLSWEPTVSDQRVARSVQFGVLSGLCFGGFFILISASSGDSGMWPLVAARIATVPIFAALLFIRKKPIILHKGTRRYTILSGVLDMSANVFYLLAFRTGYLIPAVVLTALYPAPTVLLQNLFLREKLTILRILGLILSITGAVFIGLGG